MKATSILVVLALTLPAMGNTYTFDWEQPYFLISGVIDTETDDLTITRWETEQSPYHIMWTPPDVIGSVWPALDEWGRHDVPDDWNGMIDRWGFVSEYVRAGWHTGFGCTTDEYEEDKCTWFPTGDPPSLQYLFQTQFQKVGRDDWTIGGTMGCPWFDIQPVSPGRIPGDNDLNGQFTSNDLVRTLSSGLYETGRPASWPDGDWTGDGLFNSSDMVAAFIYGAYESPGWDVTVPAVAVPEPSSLSLLLCGVLVFLCGTLLFVHKNSSPRL